jgi:fimbrial chaperone protein
VDPVRVVINEDRRTAAISIINEADQPATLKIWTLAWSQANGADVHQRSEDLIASPPVAIIAPGATQVVRIGFRRPADARRASYRIIVEEVPRTDVTGVQVALRLDLPLFARIDEGQASDLQWKTARNADGTWFVEAVNSTSRFVRVTPVDLAAATGLALSDHLKLRTVLPHSSLQWTLGKSPEVVNPARWRDVAAGENDSARQKIALQGN